MKKIIILLFITLSYSCEPRGEWMLRFANASNEQVAITFGLQQAGKKKWAISTSFPQKEFYSVMSPSEKVNLRAPCWGDQVTNNSAGDSIAIFVIADWAINNHSWQEIREKKLYKKYSSLLGDLRMNKQKQGSHFIYTGNE